LKPCANGNSERWKVVARCADARSEATTDAPDPTPTIWRLIGEALDSKAEAAQSPYDMNVRLAKPLTPTPLRRRGKIQPGDLPEWRPPEN
jgi:hypothetical protein